MLRLTIDGNEIELYENEPVNLSYQFSNLQEINASSSSFSQTFRVPLTKKNQDYFGPVNEFGLIPDWDPKTKVDAELSYNTIPVMRGFVQVKAIYVQKGKYADVELVFFGETANLSRDIGDAMLSDLDWSAYNFTWTYANVIANWQATAPALRMGFVDLGANWELGTAPVFEFPAALSAGWTSGFLQMKEVVDTILTAAGYTFESNFLDRQSDLYMLCHKGGKFPTFETDAATENLFHVGLTSNYTATGVPWQTITAWTETGSYFDTNNNFNTTTGQFSAPYDGEYTFRFRVKIETLPTNHEFHVAVWVNGVEYAPILEGEPADLTDESTYQIDYVISLEQNDTVDVRHHFHTSSDTAILLGNGNVTNPTTSFQLLNINFTGGTYNPGSNMPVMKQIEFISGIQKTFNLVFIPDRNNAKHLYIEPFTDYTASGTKKDWTNKIDLSKDITIQPTTDLQSRRYEWTHSEGKDFVNDLVQKNAGRVYGRYRVDDPDNDFATGEKKIQSPFAPFVTSYIPGTSFIIHRMLADTTDEDKSIKEPRPRLAYWNGYTSSDNYRFFGNTQTKFPNFSEYENNALSTAVDGSSLLYGTERPFRDLLVSPLNTLYYQYWRPWVNELYSSDARKLTAFFRLTKADLATFEFSDKIYLKDTYWRILSISYDATSEDLVKVDMIKVLGNIRDCSWLPYSVDKYGQLTFQNASGTTSTSVPTECCERYGYVSTSSNECFQDTPQ
jgi:hypothetical protein